VFRGVAFVLCVSPSRAHNIALLARTSQLQELCLIDLPLLHKNPRNLEQSQHYPVNGSKQTRGPIYRVQLLLPSVLAPLRVAEQSPSPEHLFASVML
jgi:hypothetical protein